jgi:hypothetical protein
MNEVFKKLDKQFYYSPRSGVLFLNDGVSPLNVVVIDSSKEVLFILLLLLYLNLEIDRYRNRISMGTY